GWFAGFTSNLVCVIWIGFDDNRDLGLTGGAAAGPIWADFMSRATTLPGYRNVKDFDPPEGVQTTVIDPEALELATPNCPNTKDEFLGEGRPPTHLGERDGGEKGIIPSPGSFLPHIFGGGEKKPEAPQNPAAGTTGGTKYDPNRPPNATGQGAEPSAEEVKEG